MIEDLVQNKKVIIIGPASYLDNSLKKEFIDSFDTVIRLNNSYKICKNSIKDIGDRTDILYHCLWGPHFPNSIPLLKNNVKILKTSYPKIPPFSFDIDRFIKANCDRVPFEIYETNKYKELCDLVGSRPNTGTMAIFDLLSYKFDRLHISGITMFDGGYMGSYRDSFMHDSREQVVKENEIYKIHNIKEQIIFLRKALIHDKITLDEEVKESIYA